MLEGALGMSQAEADELVDRAVGGLSDRASDLARRALSGALLLGELIAGTLLALVLAFFFLRDGRGLWAWLMGLLPRERREDGDEIARRSWKTLSNYLRGITIVALFVFIGLALLIIGVPAALPLALLTFFGAYIPFAGAVVTGLAAVLVAWSRWARRPPCWWPSPFSSSSRSRATCFTRWWSPMP